MRSLVVLITLFLTAYAEHYEGYKVYRVTPQNETQIHFLNVLSENEQYDFWTSLHKNQNPVDIMVTPELQEEFENSLQKYKIEYQILIDNVETTIENERRMQLAAPKIIPGKISFEKYNRHSEITAYLDKLAKTYPNIVNVESIGKSYEGRDMKIIRISKNRKPGKPGIFIDAGIHAREWAASAVALYIINQLVENSQNAHLIKKIDWHILPSLNPDGYEYSHEHVRMWRKTRSPNKECEGTDGNRNFGFHWGGEGSSSSPCSNIYRGKSAFSEAETRNVRDYILKYKSSLKLYLTIHSFGKYVLYPWGYTDKEFPDNVEEHHAVGHKVAKAIQAYSGNKYTVGCSTTLLSAAAGGSDDWAKGDAKINLAYTIELPGGGSQGFDPPPSQILPIVKEMWEGVKVFHNYIANKSSKSMSKLD